MCPVPALVRLLHKDVAISRWQSQARRGLRSLVWMPRCHGDGTSPGKRRVYLPINVYHCVTYIAHFTVL
jgi:hypothetical protein